MSDSLSDILKGIDFRSESKIDHIRVDGLWDDSRKVKPGGLFVAIDGHKTSGLNFIQDAIQRGAKCILAQKDFDAPQGVVKIIVGDARETLVKAANNFYDNPGKDLKIIGVTGTNGKTTVTYLIEDIFKKSGIRTGVIGTINYRMGDKVYQATNTTPGALQLTDLLRKMSDSGCAYAVMEVSSHSLEQKRTQGMDFSCSCFTNLTQDHLDYHKDLDIYFSAKAKLFEGLKAGSAAVINADDPFGRKLIKKTKACVLTYGIEENCDVKASALNLTQRGSCFTLEAPGLKEKVHTNLLGRHNVYNALAAWSVAFCCGMEVSFLNNALGSLPKIPGRLESVDVGQDFKVFVDYAHTDDALKNVITTLREFCKARILVVFGCGGDRDRGKRPKMARAAGSLADFVIVTSDNPRSEEPKAIMADIEKGFTKDNYIMIEDRKEAIKKAISMAKDGDFVLLAGKGHETYQIFKDRTVDFDDREVAKKCILEETRAQEL